MRSVGIVGCGKVATIHTRIVADAGDIRIAFCDRNLEKAQALAESTGSTKVYDDFEDMLAKEQLDAVHVLTRLDSHRLVAEDALKARVHVYIEKPITETRGEFEGLLDLAKYSAKTLYPGYSALGSPAIQKARRIVQSGSYGRLVTVHCDYNWTATDGGIPYGSGAHPAYSMRGGILQNLADHPASLIVHLMDDVLDAKAMRTKRSNLPHGVDDLLHVAVTGTEQVGSFTMSFGHGNSTGTLACHLERATIHVDLRSQVVVLTAGAGVPSLKKRVATGLKASAATTGALLGHAARRAVGAISRDAGIAALVENFYAVIDGKAQPIVDTDKAADVVGLLDAVWDAGA